MKMKKNSFIIFHFKEKVFEVMKWREYARAKREIEIDTFLRKEYQGLEERGFLTEKIKEVLQRINYSKEKVIVAISHQKVSSRYLKLPSQNKKEIEEMIYLQAGNILPYPPDEIAFGYQVVDTDKEGFSSVNVALTHKDTVIRILNLFKDAGIEVESVFLSTYGLAGFFKALMPDEVREVVVVNLDFPGIEMAVLNKGKIYLSRFVFIDRDEPNWRENFFKQIMDTQSLYLRQGSLGPVKKVFLCGPSVDALECQKFLEEKMLVPVEILKSQGDDLSISQKAGIDDFPGNLTGLIGIILKSPQDSLNLLPREFKEAQGNIKLNKQRRKLSIMAIITFVAITLAIFKHTDNKRIYLSRLDKEVFKLQAETKELEVMSAKLEMLKEKNKDRNQILDFFAGIHKAIPLGVFLTAVKYDSEREERFSLQGYSANMDAVFAYAANLKELNIFDGPQIKVKYATNKKTPEAEVVQFEIVCLRKK